MGSAVDALVLASQGYHTATLAGRQYRWRGDGFVEFWLPAWQGRPGEWRAVTSTDRVAELEALHPEVAGA